MTKLKSFDAEIFAIHYVNEYFKPFEATGGFSTYYVRVCEDENHQPSIYADTLPTSEIHLVNDTAVGNVFLESCDTKNEYLIKVLVDWKNKKLDTKILIKPTN